MKRVVLHVVVAAAALIAAYFAWQRGRDGGDEPEEGEAVSAIVVAQITRAELHGLTYTSEDRTVELDLEGDGPYWVTVTSRSKVRRPRPTKTPEKAAADAGAADGGNPDGGPAPSSDGGPAGADAEAAPTEPEPEPEPEVVEKTQRFVANEALDGIVENVAPLKVVRRLGKVVSSRLPDFELDEPRATLKIDLERGERVLKIGGMTYGGGNHYALDETNGEVYLLEQNLVRDIEMAQNRLMQRDLHRFEITDIASVEVVAGGRRLVLDHRNRQDPRERTWEPQEGGATGEVAPNWMRQLGRLRALGYPEAEERPADDAEPILRLEYRDESGEVVGHFEIAQRSGETAEFFGRSEATGTWVRLSHSSADQIVEDLDDIFGQAPSE